MICSLHAGRRAFGGKSRYSCIVWVFRGREEQGNVTCEDSVTSL